MKTHVLFALLVALIAAAPLTYPGPLQTHNGFTALYALMGVPLAEQAVGVLPLTLAQMLTQLGFAPLDALKSIDALAFGLGALGMFWLARHLYGNEAGLVASALYSFLPYRLMTTYIRGALGESLFWGLLPLVIFSLIQIIKTLDRFSFACTPIGIGAGRVGAGLRPAPTVPYIQSESDLRHDTKRWNLRAFVYWWLGGVLAIILWRLCVPSVPDPSQAQVYLFQIFSARWAYGGRGDWLDAVPLQLGIAPVGLSVIALAMRPARNALKLAVFACVLCLLSIMPLSQGWPWSLLLNQPWQLLGIVGMCLSLLGGSVALSVGGTANNAADAETDADPRSVERPPAALPVLAAVLTLIGVASYAYLVPRGLDYTPTHPPLARFGNEAYLVNIEFATSNPRSPITQSRQIEAGTTITVTLLWQDIAPFADEYKVFVHVIDTQDKIWAQRDRVPVNGTRPTRTWQRGELLRDTYTLTIPPNAPADLSVELGLYREDNGARLRTMTGADRVVAHP